MQPRDYTTGAELNHVYSVRALAAFRPNYWVGKYEPIRIISLISLNQWADELWMVWNRVRKILDQRQTPFHETVWNWTRRLVKDGLVMSCFHMFSPSLLSSKVDLVPNKIQVEDLAARRWQVKIETPKNHSEALFQGTCFFCEVYVFQSDLVQHQLM